MKTTSPFYKIYKAIRYNDFTKNLERRIKNIPEDLSETLITDARKYREIFSTKIDYNSSLDEIIKEKLRKEKEIKKFFKKEIEEFLSETDSLSKHLEETVSDAKNLGLFNITLNSLYEENLNLILNDNKFDGITKKYSIDFINYDGNSRNIEIKIMKEIENLSNFIVSIESKENGLTKKDAEKYEKLDIPKIIKHVNELLVEDISLIPTQTTQIP